MLKVIYPRVFANSTQKDLTIEEVGARKGEE